MELIKAIDTADTLCPNPFTLEEKLAWCHQVSASIRREAKKLYDSVETYVDTYGEVHLPDDIAFEDVEAAYFNGKYMNKVDFRTLACTYFKSLVPSAGKLKLVYLTKPEPVRNIDIKGTFDISDNFISMDSPPFKEGDNLLISPIQDFDSEPDWESATVVSVLEVLPDGIWLGGNELPSQSAVCLAIRRIIDDVTEIDDAPYDSMYVEYILAKIALYQRDYSAYNAHITQYNSLFDKAKRDYKSRAPHCSLSNFKNYWCI